MVTSGRENPWVTPQGTTDRCPTCHGRVQHFCTDPWHTQGTTDPEDVRERFASVRDGLAQFVPVDADHDLYVADLDAIEAEIASLRAEHLELREVVSAAKAWDLAHRNPYQLNMPACEKRLREAVAALSPNPEETR